MVVTKETYIAPAPWLASTFADLLENALISSGLMTGWFDSFADGLIEHRVLQVQYDPSKTYGTCYYWFVFTTSFVGVSVASGWDSVAHVPTGVQYSDFFTTATNTVNNHSELTTPLTNSTEINVVRYTSGENPAYSVFVIRNGADPHIFFIAPPSVPIVSWLDLDIVFFHHLVLPITTQTLNALSNASATIEFRNVYNLRRSFQGAIGISTANSPSVSYFKAFKSMVAYRTESVFQSSVPNNIRTIIIPYRLVRSNLPWTEDYTPVIFGISYSYYVNQPLPSDFAIYFPYTLTQFAFGDDIIVNPGIEEWEVLEFANNTSDDVANPLFLARMI